MDPFHEGLVAVFPQIRQFLSRLLDPLESEGLDSARPVLAACHALGDWLEQKPRATRSTGEILLAPPKSKAGRRVVGIPQAIIPVLHEHLAVFVEDEEGALVFPGVKGGLLRRCNFNRMSA